VNVSNDDPMDQVIFQLEVLIQFTEKKTDLLMRAKANIAQQILWSKMSTRSPARRRILDETIAKFSITIFNVKWTQILLDLSNL